MKQGTKLIVLASVLIVALIVGACVPTSTPTPSISGISGYEIVQEDYIVLGGGFLRDTAECPDGKVVLGGGAQVIGEGTSDFQTVLQESTPGTVGGGQTYLWLAAIQNNDEFDHTIGIYAVCADDLGISGYEIVREDYIVLGGGFLRDTAECPDGKVILGGGASVIGEGTSDFQTVLQESTPGTVGGGQTYLWLAAIQNNAVSDHSIAINAVCADDLGISGYEIVREDYIVLSGDFLRDATDCPDGKVVLGGGASVVGEGTSDFNTVLQESAPGTVGGGQTYLWLAAIQNNAVSDHSIAINAVCADE